MQNKLIKCLNRRNDQQKDLSTSLKLSYKLWNINSKKS